MYNCILLWYNHKWKKDLAGSHFASLHEIFRNSYEPCKMLKFREGRWFCNVAFNFASEVGIYVVIASNKNPCSTYSLFIIVYLYKLK